MIQRRRRLCFPSKSRHSLVVPGYGLRKELEGDRPLKPSILGFVHHTHPAFGEQTHNSITSGNDLIWFEISLGADQAPKRSDSAERTLKESMCLIILGKQALHFAAKSHISSAGFRKELGSPLWRFFQGSVKYFFHLLQLFRGQYASFSSGVCCTGDA
jgi:hypothetical protein